MRDVIGCMPFHVVVASLLRCVVAEGCTGGAEDAREMQHVPDPQPILAPGAC